MTRFILIDDHPIIRLGVRTLLESHPGYSIYAEVNSRDDTWEYLVKDCPDMAIMDLILGKEDGLELIKEMRMRCPDIKILVMSAQNEAVYAERVIKAGADGFVFQPEATQYLLEAVETILSGHVYLSHTTSARLLRRLLREKKPAPKQDIQTLSDRELYVYHMIGIGLATKDIASNLSRSPKTIETYKENIKKKLCLINAEALKTSAYNWVHKSQA